MTTKRDYEELQYGKEKNHNAFILLILLMYFGVANIYIQIVF